MYLSAALFTTTLFWLSGTVNHFVQGLFCLFLITIVAFILSDLSGSPMMLGISQQTTMEGIEAVREALIEGAGQCSILAMHLPQLALK